MANTQVCKPSCNDVLFGRGHQCQNHVGNCYFRETVCKRKIQYAQCKTSEKDAIAKEVYQSIKKLNPPGRFLKKADDGKYYASNDKDALTKIKQALRENSNIREKMKTTLRANKGKKEPTTSTSSRKPVTTNASVVTKDDVKKLTNLILHMD